MTPEEMEAIASQLYAAISGPDGLQCCGSCQVDGLCICAPALKAVEALRDVAESQRDIKDMANEIDEVAE